MARTVKSERECASMKNAKLIVLRLGSGFFALIALMTGARKLYVGMSGELGEAATNLAGSPALASLDNDLRFLAMCWLVVGMALMVGAIIPRTEARFYPDRPHRGHLGWICASLWFYRIRSIAR